MTEVVGLDADRLYPSIYENDEEAFEIWNKEIGIAPERIFQSSLNAKFPPLTCRSSDNPAEHITAPLIGRHDTVW